jgi:isoleucyl-tRNA synthetase
LAILVTSAPGEKCERCWTYSVSVGEDQKHPTICHRCSQVVNQLSNME